MTLNNVLISAIAGIIGILIGSFKPLIDWQIEKRRLRTEERKKILYQFRLMMVGEHTTQWHIVNSVPYSQLRPMLPKDLVTKLETKDGDFEIDISKLRWGLAPQLSDAVNEIEKRWGLL